MFNTLLEIKNDVMGCKACSFGCDLQYGCHPEGGVGTGKFMIVNWRTTLDAHLIEKPLGLKYSKLLDKLLLSSGIEKSHCYITNVIKCAGKVESSKNVPNEVICSNRYLYNEIKLLQPKVIVTFGTSAYNAVMSRGFLSDYTLPDVFKTHSLEEIFRKGKDVFSSATQTLREGYKIYDSN